MASFTEDDGGGFLKLASGAIVPVQDGVIGISPELEVLQGHDGMGLKDRSLRPLTSAEWCEIADMMIERWAAFRRTLA